MRRLNIDVLGWLLAMLIPSVVMYALQYSELNWACTNFIVIFTVALVMWVFRLVPEYAPAVFVILATMLLGLAPQSVLLSGFTSDSFFLALSVFGIGVVVIKSRLFYRCALLILTHLPNNLLLLQGIVFLIGSLLTPVMTAQSSRVALIAPLLEDIRKSAGFKPYSVAANSLACVAFNGCILLSVIFLTGKSSNFVIYGMLSEQMQWEYNWLSWLGSAAFPGLLLILVFFFAVKLQFRSQDKISVNLDKIREELANLGRLSTDEWAAIISISVLMFGLITSSIHQVPAAWFSFAIFFILMTSGIFTKADFKNRINWPFLFYLGAIIGIMRCVQEIGIDEWIVSHLAWIGGIADEYTVAFILVVYVMGWLGGLIFGTAAAPALLFTLLLPIAEHAAINTWLVAFILLMATEAWVFPYQSSYYLCYEESIDEMMSYRLAKTVKINAWFSLLRLMVILASIPYWKMVAVL